MPNKCRAEQLIPRMDLVKAGEPVAIDCEGCTLGARVGSAFRGLGRVSIVNDEGALIFDTFVYYPDDAKQRTDNPKYVKAGNRQDITKENGA